MGSYLFRFMASGIVLGDPALQAVRVLVYRDGIPFDDIVGATTFGVSYQLQGYTERYADTDGLSYFEFEFNCLCTSDGAEITPRLTVVRVA